MAKKKKKAGSKAKTPSKGSTLKSVGKAAVSAFTDGGKKKGGGKRRGKRSALWFAKEIQRLKLKKRYEKIKYRV